MKQNKLNELFRTNNRFELSEDGFTYLFHSTDEELIALTHSVDVFEFLRRYDPGDAQEFADDTKSIPDRTFNR